MGMLRIGWVHLLSGFDQCAPSLIFPPWSSAG